MAAESTPETGSSFPSSLTGVDARIVGLVGKWFPTGAHKVGAGFGCLVPKLMTGQFDPDHHKAVWPSTGNFCRGGAFDCALLGCEAIGILPEEMSRERFDWLHEIGAEVIATPGCESNVKEIYDKCWELRETRPECVIFNQFEEMGNPIWHFHATGSAVEHIFNQIKRPGDRLSGFCSATGSAGTIAAGDYLRTVSPHVRVVASEALQCPTLYECGFGGHAIEGIGDKHVPWIHNVRNTDAVAAIDDDACLALMRLFNEPAGRAFLESEGVPSDVVSQLDLLGISCICNLLTAIKTAKHYEMDGNDILFFPQTDSIQLYGSRLAEQRERHGEYHEIDAARHFGRYLEGCGIDWIKQLTLADRRAIHNLKYFTWVEQQGRTVEDLNALWSDDFWAETFARADEYDVMIDVFNQRVAS